MDKGRFCEINEIGIYGNNDLYTGKDLINFLYRLGSYKKDYTVINRFNYSGRCPDGIYYLEDNITVTEESNIIIISFIINSYASFLKKVYYLDQIKSLLNFNMGEKVFIKSMPFFISTISGIRFNLDEEKFEYALEDCEDCYWKYSDLDSYGS